MLLDEVLAKRSRDDEERIKEVIDDLKYFTTVVPSVSGIKNCIRMLSEYGMTLGQIKTTLGKFKKPILNYLNIVLHKQSNHYEELPKWFEIILLLIDNGRVAWPELNTIVEAQKANIIKILLKALKESDFGSVNYTLEHLTKMKINWPELAVIRNSLEAEAANRWKKMQANAGDV